MHRRYSQTLRLVCAGLRESKDRGNAIPPCGIRNLSFCHLSFVMLNELKASSAFDCSGSESCDQASLDDGEKQDGGRNGDHRTGGDQAPFHLQALQKAL
jgi:hypothetical protein